MPRGGSLSYVALEIDDPGRYGYLSLAGHEATPRGVFGVDIVDLRAPAGPTVVGRVRITYGDGWRSTFSVEGSAVAGGYLYVSWATATYPMPQTGTATPLLSVFDLSDPGRPRLVAEREGIATGKPLPRGDRLYLVRGDRVQVLDVSDPTSPRPIEPPVADVAGLPGEGAASLFGTTIYGTRTDFVEAMGGLISRVVALDVAEPDLPRAHASAPIDGDATDMAEHDGLLWVSTEADGGWVYALGASGRSAAGSDG